MILDVSFNTYETTSTVNFWRKMCVRARARRWTGVAWGEYDEFVCFSSYNATPHL